MGLLARLLGQSEPEYDYPELPADHPAREWIDSFREPLGRLADEVPKERIELVPSEHGGYVFIGDPHGTFGLAWIEQGEVKNLKSLTEERGVRPILLERLVEKLREAYDISKDAQRYTAELGERKLAVTPDELLERNVRGLLEQVTSKASQS
jgi:hypothetical protein